MTSRTEYRPRHRRPGQSEQPRSDGFGARGVLLIAVLAAVAVAAWVPFYLKQDASRLRTSADLQAAPAPSIVAPADTADTSPAAESADAAARASRRSGDRAADTARTARRAHPSTPVSATPTPTVPAPTAAAPVDARAATGTEDEQVVALVNAERARAGCDPVHADPKLATAALAHSEDMIDNDYFDHTSPEGESPWDRAVAAGYDQPTGENIATGQEDAATVMDAWMNSPGHRANILNCASRAIGVGLARDTEDTTYWTQMFGAV
jgi:uncharacterized protein YkwD